MKQALIASFVALTLTACHHIAANMAVNIIGEPVMRLAVEGGKAAIVAAEEYWREIGDGDALP